MANTLTGYDKAAIFMMSIGEDLAAEVMKALDPKDIRKIGAMIQSLSNVSEFDIRSVLREFSEKSSSEFGMSVEGQEFVQNVLEKALGTEKAKRIMESLASPEETGLEGLKWLDPRILAGILRMEHPQTISLIMAHLDSEQGAQTLANLPEALRNDVIVRMATLKEIPPGVMKELSQGLQNQISQVGSTTGKKVGGIQMVAGMLNQMEGAIEQTAMEAISKNSVDLADEIRQHMFIFDDLMDLDDRSMQEILKEVGKEQMAMALKAAKEELRERFFKNMSDRAAQMLKDDLEALGPVKLKDVENNQQDILKIARKLEEEGRIIVGGKGDSEMVV